MVLLAQPRSGRRRLHRALPRRAGPQDAQPGRPVHSVRRACESGSFFAAWAPCDRSLDAAALIEFAGSQAATRIGVHDRLGLGQLLAGDALEPAEAVYHHHLDLRIQ